MNKKVKRYFWILLSFGCLLIVCVFFFYFHSYTHLYKMNRIVHQSTDNFTFDLCFSKNSQFIYVISTSSGICQYDLKGHLKKNIPLIGMPLSFTLNDDGTLLGCLILVKEKFVFVEIDPEEMNIIVEKELPIDNFNQSIVRSALIWSPSTQSWITYLGFAYNGGNHETNDLLIVWNRHTFNKAAELLLGNSYFFIDDDNNIFPVPCIEGTIVLDACMRSKLWNYKLNTVIDKPLKSNPGRSFAGPKQGTYATFDGGRISVFQYDTDRILFQSAQRPPIKDDDRMVHNPGRIADINYSSHIALFLRQGGQCYLNLRLLNC